MLLHVSMYSVVMALGLMSCSMDNQKDLVKKICMCINERTSTPTRMSIMTCTVFNLCDIGHADGHGIVGLFGCLLSLQIVVGQGPW